MLKIGLIREGKIPPDNRVPLTPEQCRYLMDHHAVDIVVEPSPIRAFKDEEYAVHGIELRTDLSDRDVLLGVKEVPIDQLIPEKTYFFFSHTIKKQPHNRPLLRAILRKRIRLIDYEVLTDAQGKRVIAFGYFAGMAGAHNTIFALGRRSGAFDLVRMKDCRDYERVKRHYADVPLPPVKIVLTGTGRVGSGAAQVLRDMGIRQVDPEEFVQASFGEAVFAQIGAPHYVRHREGRPFVRAHFYAHPEEYESAFAPFARAADVMIHGVYWDPRAPRFFTREEMLEADFRIRTIGDVTCDIAPNASIPCTLRPSTIADPVYGYDARTNAEVPPYQPDFFDVMAVDNLPSELPRDASRAFGKQFIEHVFPELLAPRSPMLERATIALEGRLGPHFGYLQDYVEGQDAPTPKPG